MGKTLVDTADNSLWYLRIDDGSTYGPIVSSVLREWAGQGRIAPDDQVSEDGSTWRAAETIAELGMEWLVDAAGEPPFGPVNVGTIADLVENGAITPDARAINRVTGQAQTAGECAAGAAARVSAAWDGEPEATTAPADPVMSERLHYIDMRLRAATEALESARGELKKRDEAHERLREQGACTEQDFLRRVQELESRLDYGQEEAALTGTVLEGVRRELAEEKERCRLLRDRSVQTEEDLGRRNTEMKELAREAGELLNQAREEARASQAAYEALDARSRGNEQELTNSLESLRKDAAIAATVLELVRRELAEQKDRYRTLCEQSVRSELEIGKRVADLEAEAATKTAELKHARQNLDARHAECESLRRQAAEAEQGIGARLEALQREVAAGVDAARRTGRDTLLRALEAQIQAELEAWHRREEERRKTFDIKEDVDVMPAEPADSGSSDRSARETGETQGQKRHFRSLAWVGWK